MPAVKAKTVNRKKGRSSSFFHPPSWERPVPKGMDRRAKEHETFVTRGGGGCAPSTPQLRQQSPRQSGTPGGLDFRLRVAGEMRMKMAGIQMVAGTFSTAKKLLAIPRGRMGKVCIWDVSYFFVSRFCLRR